MVKQRPGESMDDAVQRRQKRRHDPRTQREVPPPNPSRELRPRHRASKESAGSSSRKEPRKAPYIMQGWALLMTYVPVLLLVCKLNTLLSIAPIHTFQGSRDPELFLDSKLRWKETIISRMWLLGRLARKKYTNIRRVKGLRNAFGANFMKTFIHPL